MIIRNEKLKIQPGIDFSFIAPPERIVFFDIETTGLSWKNSCIYLIGLVMYEEGSWSVRQYFAEDMGEEQELLENFEACILEKKKSGRVILISYNGDGFDIPFIKEAFKKYDLSYGPVFDKAISLDLLKTVRPLKNLLGLSNCKLKTVEKLIGIDREDKYSGGELIFVYKEYLRLNEVFEGSIEDNELNHKLKASLLETLLLHNAEDISDMPYLLGIYGYEDLVNGDFKITQSDIVEYDKGSIRQKVWDIKARLNVPLPKSLYFERSGMVLSVGEEDPYLINMTAEVYEGELKYFFVDYKNYYYLPNEDYAIHKSVGQYVDRKLRRQATKSTCYQRKQGLFVPLVDPILPPVFYKDDSKELKYASLDQIFDDNGNSDETKTKRYILSVVKQLV